MPQHVQLRSAVRWSYLRIMRYFSDLFLIFKMLGHRNNSRSILALTPRDYAAVNSDNWLSSTNCKPQRESLTI